MSLLDAYEETVSASAHVDAVDSAVVESGRVIARRIDEAIEFGEGQEVTKALYLTPHLINILREILATPAARKAHGVDDTPVGSKLSKLRAVHGGKSA